MNEVICAGLLMIGPNDGTISQEIARWGMSVEFVERGYMASRRYRDSAAVIAMLNPMMDEETIRQDAIWRFRIWNELDNVVRLRSEGSIQWLREYLGEEAFILKRLPAPTAWGYE